MRTFFLGEDVEGWVGDKQQSVELVRRTDQRGGERQTASKRTHPCVFGIEIWKEAGGGLRVEVENKNARRSRVEIRRSKGSRVPGRFDPTISSYPKTPPNLEFDGAFPGQCVAITSPDKPTRGYCHADTVTGGLAANALVSLDVFQLPAFTFSFDFHPYRTPTSTLRPEARIPSQLYLTSNHQQAHVDCNRANTYCVGIEPLCIPDEREQSPAVHHSSKQNADLSTAIYGTLADQYYSFQWQRS
ncbi:hypothetical protein ASPTUDRAFT_53420 [Aspergillus tubingensis CBS 134.48]|uniref:Uncharacterized protein n=1 Tax=Aspergillus tubingensis (strain CBS 134.48) TaxID=767770 RepID=A0A1L9NA69_ASPTC|nr:hypothetical protein ASPTUDRAFT_53420 [Aspergillus tubingensis CBS 134.48]